MKGEFDWSKDVQTSLLSAFFYGYMTTQVLGGWLSDKFGAKPSLILGMGMLSIGSMLSPALVR